MEKPLCYDVAGLRFRIHSENITLLNSVLTSFQPFNIKNYNETNNHLFDFYMDSQIEIQGDNIYSFDWEGTVCEIFKDDNNYYIRLFLNEEEFELMKADFNWSHITTTVKAENKDSRMCIDLFLMFCYCFASVIYDTLLIHASVIIYKEKALVFQGKSGTGKSTHASLWLKNHPESFLLNDDNPVVRIDENDKIKIFGSPWSGKTPCYINENYEVEGFVRLSQAPFNKLEKLSLSRAFASILPSCSNMLWDKRVHSKICDTITKISINKKSWSLKCLPDEQAVLLTKSIIDETVSI